MLHSEENQRIGIMDALGNTLGDFKASAYMFLYRGLRPHAVPRRGPGR